MKCQIPFSGNFKMSSAENITQSTKSKKGLPWKQRTHKITKIGDTVKP